MVRCRNGFRAGDYPSYSCTPWGNGCISACIPFIIPVNNWLYMETDEKQGRRPHRHHNGNMLIPAGVLLGLGIGLLAGYPGPGVLIGLGLGFIGATLVKSGADPTGDAGAHQSCDRSHGFLAIIGAFLIIVGIGIAFAPLHFWPYIAAAFLILLGVWFLYRAVAQRDP